MLSKESKMKIYASSEISFIDESEDEALDYGTEKQTLLEPRDYSMAEKKVLLEANNIKSDDKVRKGIRDNMLKGWRDLMV